MLKNIYFAMCLLSGFSFLFVAHIPMPWTPLGSIAGIVFGHTACQLWIWAKRNNP